MVLLPLMSTGHLFFLLILQVGSFVVLQAYTDKDVGKTMPDACC